MKDSAVAGDWNCLGSPGNAVHNVKVKIFVFMRGLNEN